jgi:hypothetical protein
MCFVSDIFNSEKRFRFLLNSLDVRLESLVRGQQPRKMSVFRPATPPLFAFSSLRFQLGCINLLFLHYLRIRNRSDCIE